MSTQQKLERFAKEEPRRDYTEPGDGLITKIVGRRYTDEGVKILKESNAGGVWTGSWEIVEWGESEDIKQCPGCGGFHSAHNPALCHSCAFGVN